MKPARREALVLTAAGLAAAAAGFLAGPILLGGKAGEGDQALLSEGLVDMEGKPRKLTDWRGSVLVCNFWATWCAPCREEIPLLAAARDRYRPSGVEIVGIAIDTAAKVVEFTRTFNIPYPLLLAEASGLDLMRRLGNSSGGLPYTVFFNRQGDPVHRKLGALKKADLDEILGPMSRA